MVATTHACQILKLVLLAWNLRRGVDQIDLPWHIRVKGPLKGRWGGERNNFFIYVYSWDNHMVTQDTRNDASQFGRNTNVARTPWKEKGRVQKLMISIGL
jgi:hypothetical protein